VAAGRGTELVMASGPYVLTRENAPLMASTINYRHYKPEELQIARNFVSQGHILGTWFFDVFLETPRSREILASMQPTTTGEAQPWMNRIDAVAREGRVTHVIEFKDALRPGGIGQLVYYGPEYARQYDPSALIQLDYVVHVDRPELHSTLEENEIRLWLV
jgi:hypothetical protein